MSIQSTDRIKEAKFATWVGLWVNVILSVLKIAAGYIAKSSVIIADGVHSLSDFLTDALVIVGFNFAGKPVDESHDYGHGKFETLASTLIGLILLAVGIGILWSGVDKIIFSIKGGTLDVPGWLAFWAAVVSIAGNEWLYWYQIKVGKRLKSNAIVANAWHHRSDALTSVAALLGIGGAIFLGNQWVILDPVAAVIVSLLVIKTAYDILKDSIMELTEASMGREARIKILEIAEKIPEIKNPHHIQTRKIGSYAGIDLHIEVDDSLNIVKAHTISHELEDAIRIEFGEECFINIHIEPEGSSAK